MSTLIKLPDERFAQLQELAESEDLSIADFVGLLIRTYQKNLRIPAFVPGFAIGRAEEDKIVFENEAIELMCIWTSEQASSFAGVLEIYSAAGKMPSSRLDMDAGVQIDRRGTSVKITNIENQQTVTLARSVAREVAELLRDAVNGGAETF